MLRTFWVLALFATGVIAGCSGKTSPPLNPTVVSTAPASSATGVPLAQVVTATFSEAMNHATINPAGGGTMVGTLIASMGISFSTPGNAAVCTLNGRAIALNASVTMV